MIKGFRQYRAVPSFDDVMKEQAKPIPSFDDVMGNEPTPVKKKDVSSVSTSNSNGLSSSQNVFQNDPVKYLLQPLRDKYQLATNDYNPYRNKQVSDATANRVLPTELVNHQAGEENNKRVAEKQSLYTLNAAHNAIKQQFDDVKSARQAVGVVKKNNGGIIPKDNETAQFAQEGINQYNQLSNGIIKNKGIVGAAIQDELKDNPQFKNYYKTLGGKIPKSYEGRLVESYLARNGKNVQNFAEEHPEFKNELDNVTSKFNQNYPETTAANIGNEVSQAYEKKYNKAIDFNTSGFNQNVDDVAKELYSDDPQKLELYNKLVKDNKNQYFKSAAPLTVLGKGMVEGVDQMGNTLKDLVGARTDKDRAFEALDQQGKYVDAKPTGIRELLATNLDFGGKMLDLAATGNVLGGLGASATAANSVPAILQFHDQNLKDAEGNFGSNWKAKLSADVSTAMFASLGNAIPAAKIRGAIDNIVKGIGEKASVTSVKAQLGNAIAETIKQYAKGTGEMTAMTAGQQIVDAALGQPHSNYENELYNSFKGMAEGNILPSLLHGIGAYAGTKVEKPNELRSAIDELPENTYTSVLKTADGKQLPEYLKNIAEQLNSSESEANTTRKVFGDKISDIALKLYPDAKPEPIKTDIAGDTADIPDINKGTVGEGNIREQVDNKGSGENIGNEKVKLKTGDKYETDAFHGTSEDVKDFDVNNNQSKDGRTINGVGWFSDHEAGAKAFGGNVISRKIKFDNPLVIDASKEERAQRFKLPNGKYVYDIDYIKEYYVQKAKDKGHDGVIFLNARDGNMSGTVYGVFKNENIKQIVNKGSGEGIGDKEGVGDVNVEHEAYKEFPELKGTKVVNESGEPLVVYHGTQRKFDKFEIPSYFGDVKYATEGGAEMAMGGKAGIYFSSNKEGASTYTQLRKGKKGYLKEAYLDIKNPYIINAEGKAWVGRIADEYKVGLRKIKFGIPDENGNKYDGIIVKNVIDAANEEKHIGDVYVVTKQPKPKEQSNTLSGIKENKTDEAIPDKVQNEKVEGLFKKAAAVEDLTSPRERVLQHFANGGKIHTSSVEQIFGNGVKSTEGERRSRIDLLRKDAPTIEQLAHQLWESDPTGKFNTSDYKNAIEQVVSDHKSRASTAKELIGVREAAKHELNSNELKNIDDKQLEQLHKIVQGLPDNQKQELTKLLETYQNEYGLVDWDRLEKDSNGFEPKILNLSEETQKSLYDLIEKNNNPESGSESTNANGENILQAEGQKERQQTENQQEPPIEPPKEKEPIKEGEDGGKKKGVLNHLVESKNISEETKQGLVEHGLKYDPKSQEENAKLAKAVVDEMGIDDAVLHAEAHKLSDGVNSAVFAESLNRLYEQELNAKTPEEKLEAAKKFSDISDRYDKWARKGGREIAQISNFYKKSPLGITISENKNRKQAFNEWSKPKEKEWKEFFSEMSKEPEFETFVKEQVKEGMKNERAAERAQRKEKVHKTIDDTLSKWANKLKAKGTDDAQKSGIGVDEIFKAVGATMKKAYDAGEAVTKIVQDAIDYISEKLGHDNWDREGFRKEWEAKLSEKDKKKPLTDEELKAKILDKFRKKLKGLSDKEKEEAVRRAFKEIIENGGLEYEDFKKIISDVTGRGEMTPEEANRLKELIGKTNQVEEAAKNLREQRTEAAYIKYRAAMLETAKATKEINEMLWNKPNVMRRLTSIMQLNTLGIPSLVNNPIYNIWNQMMVRFPVGIVNDAIDRGLAIAAKAVGKDYEREYNVWGTQAEFFKGLGLGTKESLEQFLTGLNRQDLFQKEIYGQQIRPFKSMAELFAWKMGKKKLTPKQVIDKSLQATVGIPAEIVARVLNIGDKPQRFAAESAQGAAFAKALGLKGMDARLFMEFPREEAYRAYQNKGLSDEAAAKKADYVKTAIEQEGKRSTFQQDNMLNDFVSKIFGGEKSGIGQFAKAITVSPFIKIPSNAFWSAYNLINPEVAMVQAMWHGSKAYRTRNAGDNYSALQAREGRYWFAHAIVGIALRAAIIPLAKAGIFNSANTQDDTKKEREGEQNYEQQGAINLTKLAAFLRGGDPSKIEGGLTLQNRWLGQMGVIGNTIARKYDDMTPEQREAQGGFWDAAFGGLEKEGLIEAQNGIFSNSAALLQAFNSKGSFGFDQYFRNVTGMLSNTFQPAMFAQTSRQQLPYVPQYKADNFLAEVKNDMLTRSSWLRKLTGQYPPSKISIWGEPLMRPDNTAMRMFGISNTNKDAFAYPIYEDYKKTGDIGFFPPSVMPNLNGQKLDTKEQNVLETYIGQARKSYVAPFINDAATIEGFDKTYGEIKDPEIKKKVLSYLYQLGRIEGVAKFIEENPKFQKADKSEYEQEMNDAFEEFKKSLKE
jgi:hypothetical protein